MHIGNIQHRTNGTIDIDFYRREALLLRREGTNSSWASCSSAGH